MPPCREIVQPHGQQLWYFPPRSPLNGPLRYFLLLPIHQIISETFVHLDSILFNTLILLYLFDSVQTIIVPVNKINVKFYLVSYFRRIPCKPLLSKHIPAQSQE